MMENLLTDAFDENYKRISENIAAAAEKAGKCAADVTLLAATKTVAAPMINYAISKGIGYIGENRVQEFLQKNPDITNDVHRHFIGHLQTNKVKDIVGKVELIQSVDSIRLAEAIAKQSQKLGITTDILIEVNIGNEQSKSGFAYDEVSEIICQINEMQGICVKGFMTIPPVSDENEKNRHYFDKMYKLFIDNKGKKIDNNIEILSMGMSDDYETAIECGANLVRIGTALFGRRIYK